MSDGKFEPSKVVSFTSSKRSLSGGIEGRGAGVGDGTGLGSRAGVGVTGGSSTSAIDVRDVLIERSDAAMFFRCSSVIGSAMHRDVSRGRSGVRERAATVPRRR